MAGCVRRVDGGAGVGDIGESHASYVPNREAINEIKKP
jgi:hypothetical protein